MQAHSILPLFPAKHRDLYRMIRENIVGGFAIVCHRMHEAGVSRLPNGELAAWIVSLDCNSLYLWGLGEPTGTGVYGVWTTKELGTESEEWKPGPKTDKWVGAVAKDMKLVFTREMSYTKCKRELEWLEWYAFSSAKTVEHRFNGRQKTVKFSGEIWYPVDGYIPEERTIIPVSRLLLAWTWLPK